MSDDKPKKLLEDQNELSRFVKESSDAHRQLADQFRSWREPFEVSSALRRAFEDANRQHELLRAALGPAEDLRRSLQAFAHQPLLGEVTRLAETFSEYEKRFRVPVFGETARLVQSHQDMFADIARRHHEQMASIQRSIDSIRSPWLDATKELQSLSGFTALQGIGRAVKNLPAFDDRLAGLLRSDLGDWRDQLTLPERIHDDVLVRTDFYAARGFDPKLTDFPAAAFGESLDIEGLREPPPIVIAYGPPVPTSSDPREEEGLKRTNSAHDWLLRMETQLRQFIDRRMTQAHGADWPRHRLANGVYDQWKEKKQKAEQADGRSFPLIAYADFTDYEPIITRRDDWQLFSAVFVSRESVRESFQRLYPIRLCTMHARIITQDDELLLYVEIRRLIKSIETS